MTRAFQGSCLCGKEKFEFAELLPNVAHCHCSMCQKFHGAAFFSPRAPADVIEIALGALDTPIPVKPGAHIFVASGADCYEIADDLPQHEKGRPGNNAPEE